MKRILLFGVTILFLVALLGTGHGSDLPYVEGEALVKLKAELKGKLAERRRLLSDFRVHVRNHYPTTDVFRVTGEAGDRTDDMIRRLRQDPSVEYAEPNYKRYLKAVTPNDPLFVSQWALENMACPDAWVIETGDRSIVIAFVDSGIDYAHEDLRDNLWRNLSEDWLGTSPGNNGLDDDGDGYIDNYYGINTITGSGDPFDDEGHGTHVAGIAGAEGNNLTGVTGVNWRVSLMALKFIGANGFGSVGDEIEAIEFASRKGVKVMNLSFGSSEFSTPERDAITAASGILFIAAAGNERSNNDLRPSYPANYDLPNIISVANSMQSDALALSSNFGPQTVSLAAPGQSILSTVPNDLYDTLSGSSMSTAFVSGLAALVLARTPGMTVSGLKDQILRTVDVVPELEARILTGGRANAHRALTEQVAGPYIYRISPEAATEGDQVTLRGSRFRASPGKVVFEPNVEGSVVSWTNEKILCQVPEGAVSGIVKVVTSEGTSNGVAFAVSETTGKIIPTPQRVRIFFPNASTEPGEEYFLTISNFYDHQAMVSVKVMGESGNNTIKFFNMRPYGKVLVSLGAFGVPNEKVFVQCEGEEMFGAGLARMDAGANNVIFMYPFVFVEKP
jgi:subtilisin family serine protease